MQLLGALGPDFPLPILLVQHISSNFLDGFAAWLQSVCPFSVNLENREIPARGKIYLAARERHLRLSSDYVETDAGRSCLSAEALGNGTV